VIEHFQGVTRQHLSASVLAHEGTFFDPQP